MNLDELQKEWTVRDQRLEKSIQLNTRLLRESRVDRHSGAIRRWSLFDFLIQLPFYLLTIGALGKFIASHLGEPKYVIAALLIDAWCIAMLGALFHQFTSMYHFDLGEPVLVVQKRLTAIRLTRLHTLKWAFLSGSLVWSAPFLMVVAEAMFDVDLESMSVLLVAYSVGSGLVALLVVWLLQRYDACLPYSKLGKAVRDSLAGRDIAEASAFLNRLTHFESDAAS